MHNGLIQNILKGHCSQRIFGPDAQTLFTWSSFWDSLSAWEKAIYNKPHKEFVKSEAWLQNGQMQSILEDLKKFLGTFNIKIFF